MPHRLHHLALRTESVPRLAAFYQAAFGLSVARENEGSVWLESGRCWLMIEARGVSEPGVPAGSMELIAFAVDDLAAAEARLEAAGAAIEARTDYTIYARDPDGRRVGASTYGDGPRPGQR